MKIRIAAIGKHADPWLESGIREYEQRLGRYCSFDFAVVPDIKNGHSMPADKLKEKEADQLLSSVLSPGVIVLLDERGRQMSSRKFADFFNELYTSSSRGVTFVIGGAWGVAPRLRQQANTILSLSEMTFSHRMVRLFLIEQIYRAHTILRNEQYHND
jgi:23S rRNA (pseudouridine1915-N3)-methyltransferase